jgi:hypothetical protein
MVSELDGWRSRCRFTSLILALRCCGMKLWGKQKGGGTVHPPLCSRPDSGPVLARNSATPGTSYGAAQPLSGRRCASGLLVRGEKRLRRRVATALDARVLRAGLTPLVAGFAIEKQVAVTARTGLVEVCLESPVDSRSGHVSSLSRLSSQATIPASTTMSAIASTEACSRTCSARCACWWRCD